jgi:cobalt-zinc-cadmium efflux system protein
MRRVAHDHDPSDPRHGHDHGHDHDHGHAHGHGHAHAVPDSGRAFAIGVLLNTGIVLAEAIYGVVGHSMALLADAGHNLGDVLGLLLAWGATVLAKRAPSGRRTYGLKRGSILAALGNAALLLFATGAVAWESIQRLAAPGDVDERGVMVVAALAVVVNGASALLFLRGKDDDLNVRSAFLHLAGDAAIALGVVVSGAVIYFTHWNWLDPVTSLAVSALVLWSTWALLRKSLDLALDAAPEHVDPEKVRAYLAALPGVTSVHDLHVWAMSTTETALTAHLVLGGPPPAGFLARTCEQLHDEHRIAHATIQIETTDDARTCELVTHTEEASAQTGS